MPPVMAVHDVTDLVHMLCPRARPSVADTALVVGKHALIRRLAGVLVVGDVVVVVVGAEQRVVAPHLVVDRDDDVLNYSQPDRVLVHLPK